MSGRGQYNHSPERKKGLATRSPESRSRDPYLRSNNWEDRGSRSSGHSELGQGSGHASRGKNYDQRAGQYAGYSGRDKTYRPHSKYRNEASYRQRVEETTPKEKICERSPAVKKDKKFLAKDQIEGRFEVDDDSSDDSTVEQVGKNEKKFEEQVVINAALKDKLKKRSKELGNKEVEVVALKEELEDLKAENAVNIADIGRLRKRKEKTGTLQIVKNLEMKNAKLTDSNNKLKAQAENLIGNVAELESEMLKKDEEIMVLLKKDKVARKSRKHLQHDLLTATTTNKSSRADVNKLKLVLKNLKEENPSLAVEKNKISSMKEDVKNPNSEDVSANDHQTTEVNNSSSELEDVLAEESGDDKESATIEIAPSPSSTNDEVFDDVSGIKSLNKESDESFNDSDESIKSEDFIIKKALKKKGSDEEDLGNLADDDSFFHPPNSSQKVGKNIVKNFAKRGDRHAAPPSRPLRSNNTNNNTVTILNQKISFIAVRDATKTPHDGEEFGTRPCGLSPYCNQKWTGGEDIGMVKVISPDFHPKFEEDCWVCWVHTEASLAGMEAQTQVQDKALTTSTPKNARMKRSGAALTNAPMKKSAKKSKPIADNEAKASNAEEKEK